MNGTLIQRKLEETLLADRFETRARHIVKAAIRNAQMAGRPVRNMEDLERAIIEYQRIPGRLRIWS